MVIRYHPQSEHRISISSETQLWKKPFNEKQSVKEHYNFIRDDGENIHTACFVTSTNVSLES